MIPKIIHRTAKTKNLSREERRLLDRSRKLMPDWEHRLWDDADNLALLETHFPEFAGRYRAISRGVAKSDVARCCYMYVHGGVYCDTDYKWLKPFPESWLGKACILPVSRGETPGPDGDFRLGNAIFASRAGHPFWLDFLRHVLSAQGLDSLAENRIEKTTGPEGLTDFYRARGAAYPDIRLVPRAVFHPEIVPPGFTARTTRDTVGIHLCWGNWRSKTSLAAARTVLVRKGSSLF